MEDEKLDFERQPVLLALAEGKLKQTGVSLLVVQRAAERQAHRARQQVNVQLEAQEI